MKKPKLTRKEWERMWLQRWAAEQLWMEWLGLNPSPPIRSLCYGQ